jgi:acrosin
VNIGSLSPQTGGTVNAIQGAVTVTGNGGDTLDVDDSGDTNANSGTLTSTSLTGLGMGGSGISYSGLIALNISLGSHGNTFNIQGTGATTTLKAGAGVNTINVGSVAPQTGGIVNNVQNLLTVIGGGGDTLNIDDTGSAAVNTGALTGSALSGLGMGAGRIAYSGLAALKISLGSGRNTFTINSTNAGTVTTLNSGSGADTVDIVSAASVTNVNTQGGDDTVSVEAAAAAVNINSGTGADVINIGSFGAPSGGTVNGIKGAITVVGAGVDTMNVDDTGSTIGQTGTSTATITGGTLTGLGMGAGGISYSGLSALNIFLGGGGNTFTIASTFAATVTTVNGGTGNDTVNILTTASLTYVNTQAGSDTVNVLSTSAPVDINTGTGASVVNAGSVSPQAPGTVNNIQGALTVTGGGGDTLNVDDTLSVSSKTGTLTGATLTGLGMAGGIIYSGLGALNISLGSGANTFRIVSTNSRTVTTLNSGAGNDTVNVQSTGGATAINTGAGTSTVNVGSLEPSSGGVVNNIQGALTVGGGGGDTLNVDDTGSAGTKTGTLTGGALTGLAMGGGISYSGLSALNISLGGGNNTFTIASTNSNTVTTLNSGGGSDTVNILTTASVTNVNTQGGNDTVNVRSTGAALNLDTGAGTVAVNIGSLFPQTGGVVNTIQGAVTLTGGGADTLNVDDTGESNARTGTLTGTTLTGLGMGAGGISYSGVSALNIFLGGGANTFTVASTNANTVTTLDSGGGNSTVNILSTASVTYLDTQAGNDTVNIQSIGAAATIMAGAGTDVINVGSLQPQSGGTLNSIQGALTVSGNGSGTMNIDDSGSTAAKTGQLTGTTLTGLGLGAAGISYSGLSALNISLGSGGNTFTIASTSAGTATTLNSGKGNDTVTILTTGSLTNINTQAGNDTVNVRDTGAPTTINTGTGADTINVGSLAPQTDGILDNIQGLLTVVGNGSDIMNIDDTGSTGPKAGTLTASGLIGLALGQSGNMTYQVQFSSNLTQWTNVGTVVSSSAQVNWTGPQPTGVFGFYRILESLPSGVLLPIAASETIAQGVIQLSWANNIITSPSSALAAGGISYSGLSALNISLGSGGNTFTIASTSAGTTTTLNSGSGNDTVTILTTGSLTNVNTQAGNDIVNVRGTGGPATINTGTGADIINVGSLAPQGNGTLGNIQGLLTVVGNGSDILNIDDTGSTGPTAGVLTASTLTGVTPGPGGNMTYQVQFSTNLTQWINVGTVVSSSAQVNFTATQPVGQFGFYRVLGLLPTGIVPVAASVTIANGAVHLSWTNTIVSQPASPLLAGGISYSGLSALNISLGNGGNTFTVASTNAGTTTTLNSGNGNNTLDIQGTGGITNLSTGRGINTINVGSLAPLTGGLLSGIEGALTVTGSGSDTMNVDDTGSTAATTGTLTPAALTGLGMGTGGITYSGLSALNVSLGSGQNTFKINDINPATDTTINGGFNAADSLSASFAADFTGNLNIFGFAAVPSILVAGSFLGTMTVGAPSTIGLLSIGVAFTGQLIYSGPPPFLVIGGAPHLLSGPPLWTGFSVSILRPGAPFHPALDFNGPS